MTDYCTVGRPRVIFLKTDFPAVWNADEYARNHQPYWDTQPSTQAELTSTHSSVVFQHTRSTTATTSPTPPKVGEILQKDPSSYNDCHVHPEIEITNVPRQKPSLRPRPVCDGDIMVSQRSPQSDFPHVPATTHRLASPTTRSTSTEEPRRFISSRTGGSKSTLGVDDLVRLHSSVTSCSIEKEDASNSDVLPRSLFKGDAISKGAKTTERSTVVEVTETLPSRNYKLIFRKMLRSLQRRFQPIPQRARRFIGSKER